MTGPHSRFLQLYESNGSFTYKVLLNIESLESCSLPNEDMEYIIYVNLQYEFFNWCTWKQRYRVI